MPNEFDEHEKTRRDENRLPPDLAELESRLGELKQVSTSTLDRDELMFQSGYAAAMATKEPCPKNSKIGVARWGWPAVSGTLGTVAAVLAIMLWAAPVETGESQLASTPTVASPLVVDVKTPEAKEVSDVDKAVALATANPIREAVSSYLENVFQAAGSEESVLVVRNRRLAEVLSDEPEQPRIRTRKSRPLDQTSPNSQNQQLRRQLWFFIAQS